MNRHGRWVFLILLGIIIVAFLFWDYGVTNMSAPQTTGATVYGRRITSRELDAAKRMATMMMGQKAHLTEREDALMEGQILQRMALMEKAQKLGLSVNDEEVVMMVRDFFQKNGRFEEAIYAQFKESLAPRRLTEADFENMIRGDILVRKLMMLIASTAKITPLQFQAFAGEITQKLTAFVCHFDLVDFMGQVRPTEDQLRGFYRENSDEFRTPKRQKVAYVSFPIDVSKVKISEEEVQAVYEQNKMFFTQNGKTKPMKEVAVMLRNELSHRKALQQAHGLATEFTVKLVPEPDKPPLSFDALAKESKLEVKQTDFFSANDLAPGIPTPVFTAAAFGLDEENPVSDPVNGPGAVYVLRWIATDASSLPPFEQVSKKVRDTWTTHEALKLAREKGEEKRRALMALLDEGKTFEWATASLGIKPRAIKSFSATDPMTNDPRDGPIRRAALQLETGEIGEFVPQMTGGFFVYVAAREPTKPEEIARIEPEVQQILLREQQERVFHDFQQSVMQEAQVHSPPSTALPADKNRTPAGAEDRKDIPE